MFFFTSAGFLYCVYELLSNVRPLNRREGWVHTGCPVGPGEPRGPRRPLGPYSIRREHTFRDIVPINKLTRWLYIVGLLYYVAMFCSLMQLS